MKYFSVDDQIGIVNNAVLKASMSAIFDSVNQHPEGLFRYKVAKFLGKRKEVYGNYLWDSCIGDFQNIYLYIMKKN